MLRKLRNALAPLLLHPGITAVTMLTGVVSGLTAIGSQLQQLGWQLGPVMYYLPHSTKVVVALTIGSSVCTMLAGFGRSVISFVDKNQTPDAEPAVTPHVLPTP